MLLTRYRVREVFQAVERGAVLLTAGNHLAWVLSQQFNAYQQERGLTVWPTPEIMPIRAYLGRLWRETLLKAEPSAATPMLLNSVQEQFVWEQVIRDSEAGQGLLRIPETAQAAMRAWEISQIYRLPLDGRFEASDDCSAFLGWAHNFEARLHRNGWVEAARLPDLVSDFLRSGAISPPPRVFLAGFEQLAPQQVEFLDALGRYEQVYAAQIPDLEPAYLRYPDPEAELAAAAHQSRLWLENNPAARIGIVVPDLQRLRNTAERIFRRTLHPSSPFSEGPHSFHFSLGCALADHPLVSAALLMLEFSCGPVTLARGGRLLRSPLMGGYSKESAGRALLDAELRSRNVWEISLPSLCERSGRLPLLRKALKRASKLVDTLRAQQSPSAWSRTFSKLLTAYGWPGERALNSADYQVAGAWRDLLSIFASLDHVATGMGFEDSVARLRGLAAGTPFQVENEGAPIQIMGLLEASGLTFDHLWITGLHDQALPLPVRPNPFLPLRMQVEYGVPRSSPSGEVSFATKLLDTLVASARDVVMSYPLQRGEEPLAPTALLGRELWSTPAKPIPAHEPVPLESLADEFAPPLPDASVHRGGTRIFADMAACPFRAFAIHRLGARELEHAGFGIRPREKGTFLHRVLERIWGELGSHERLCATPEPALRELISNAISRVFDNEPGFLGRSLESTRLQNLVFEWLEIEGLRAPFQVLHRELKREITVNDLPVHLRVDRVDELPDGSQVILDYKTGDVRTRSWEGERPDEPQVPLYCISNDGPLAAAALVQLQTHNIKLNGIDAAGAFPNGIGKMQLDRTLNVSEQIEEWRRVLGSLATRFSSGHAAVDPKEPKENGTCKHCRVTAFCRVRELGCE